MKYYFKRASKVLKYFNVEQAYDCIVNQRKNSGHPYWSGLVVLAALRKAGLVNEIPHNIEELMDNEWKADLTQVRKNSKKQIEELCQVFKE